jgi:hypothetical protein
VVVAMAVVRAMQMSAHNKVDVIAVRHGVMSAAGAVLVATVVLGAAMRWRTR